MFEEVATKLFWSTWFSSFTIEFAVMFSKMSHGVVGVLREGSFQFYTII